MNKIFLHMVIGAVALFTVACDSDDKLKDIVPATSGTVTDDMGNVYRWVQIGDQQWTTENARNGVSMTEAQYFDILSAEYEYVFDDDDADYLLEDYIPVYGNLMTYDEAVKSAPEGWRLPTDEDWKKLEATLGMKDADKEGIRGEAGVGYKLQEMGTGCDMALTLHGGINKKKVYGWYEFTLDNMKEYGWYWTATEGPIVNESVPTAWYRKVFSSNGGVDRRYGSTADKLMAVRWVRDIK